MHIFNPTTLVGIHSLISVVAIILGIPAIAGLLRGQDRTAWITAFLMAALATNVSGFIIPASAFLPSHATGIVSFVALGAALLAGYRYGPAGRWRAIHGASIIAAEYLLVFVAIAQSFLKVPALAATIVDTQAPFALSALVALLAFVALGWAVVRQSRAPFAAAA